MPETTMQDDQRSARRPAGADGPREDPSDSALRAAATVAEGTGTQEVDVESTATEPGTDEPLDAARELAEQLRTQGVVVVASRALTAARPNGIDLLGALGVLTAEVAHEWIEAAERLQVLDVDRLQVRSAAALLSQAAAAAGGDGLPADALDPAAVARAVALRTALQSVHASAESRLPEANPLLDRTWAVLCDLRRLAVDTGNGSAATDSATSSTPPPVVPSAAEVDADQARALPPALHRAACAGALVGLLSPWLPPPHAEPLAAVDALLESVSAMARAGHDRAWWAAMITVGRVAASLSVAAAHAAAVGYAGAPARATALTLSEPAFDLLVSQALQSAAGVVGSPATGEGHGADEPVRGMPQASPSQQARAAAERAAAERRATQQAFVERANATRAAARQEPPARPAAVPDTRPMVAVTPTLPSTVPPQSPTQPAQPTQPSHHGEQSQPVEPGESVESVTMPPPSTVTVGDAAARDVPPIAQVQADLGELEDDEIDLGVWDTLMRPR